MSLNKTGIEWTHCFGPGTGCTWNPITGCTANCPYCYARELANTRLANVYPNGFAPTFWLERLHDVTPKQKPRGIFIGSMSDLWDEHVPQDWRDQVWERMILCEQHVFFTLTKQPQNMTERDAVTFDDVGVNDHLWQGVSITGQEDLRRYGSLRTCAHPFISFEPLIAPVYTLECLWRMPDYNWPEWFVIGADSRPTDVACKAEAEWVLQIAYEARQRNIPVFAKGNLTRVMGAQWVADHQQWPHELQRLREAAS